MTETEGVIQYRLEWRPGGLPPGFDHSGLDHWFRRCRALDLIGRDPTRYDGFAFGNISVRVNPGFVISATQTGGRSSLGSSDLAWVRDFDVTGNRLRATGPARPSSEAMTHGQLYRARPGVGAVIHVHSPVIWRHAEALALAVTDPEAGYGTPQMAAEVERLVSMAPDVDHGVFSMGGHDDGVVAYGEDLSSAGDCLLDALRRAGQVDAADQP